MNPPPIFLIGLRGSGKTTLGKQLAQTLNRPFLDTDEELMQQHQSSIAQMIAQRGWDYFRAQESAILHQMNASNAVIATGGGVILAEQNRQFIKQNGVCFYLSVPIAVLVQRLTQDPKSAQRPAFTALPLFEELNALHQDRLPYYLETATKTINAHQYPEQIIACMTQFLKENS